MLRHKKHAFQRGAAKNPSEAASLREKSFPQCRAKFSAVGRANISADRDTNALHHRRSKKVPASEPKEFSPRGAGNKRRSAVMRGKKVFRLPCSSRNRSVVSVGLRGVSAAVVLRCDKLHPGLRRAAKIFHQRLRGITQGSRMLRHKKHAFQRASGKNPSGCVFQKKSLRRKPGRDSFFLIRYMFLLR